MQCRPRNTFMFYRILDGRDSEFQEEIINLNKFKDQKKKHDCRLTYKAVRNKIFGVKHINGWSQFNAVIMNITRNN